MKVSAIIVTRGNVDLEPVLDSLPDEWEKIIWNNGAGAVFIRPPGVTREDTHGIEGPIPNFSVYGRYAAIEHASHDLIYVQDDDVIVSDPLRIAECWYVEHLLPLRLMYPADDTPPRIDHLVANMPREFRHDGYTDSCLVGFGACFHRDASMRAFQRYWEISGWKVHPLAGLNDVADEQREHFLRTCDVVFTTLTPHVLVDVPKENREFASDMDRMWRQPEHYGERVRMLELARKVRDQ